MAKLNLKPDKNKTHGGGIASHINPEQQLRRSVMSCMLWERGFYEEGEAITARIIKTIPLVKPEIVAEIAVTARSEMKLRHVPLLIVREMARLTKHKKYVADTLISVIQRPDELTEFLAIYWKDERQPLSAQVKKGLAKAFNEFSAYALAKYNRDGAVKLKDVLFLCHAKPKDKEQETLWKQLISGKLTPPDTWEVSLSAGKNKKDTWTRLIKESKLGGLAMLRNLRNMSNSNVSEELIKQGMEQINVDRILPFRFLVAAKHNPDYEEYIENTFNRCCLYQQKLKGKTILIVDVSGSMYGGSISRYSELNRAQAASSLAVLVRGICDNAKIYATAGSDSNRTHKTQKVPARKGFALSDAVYSLCSPLGGGGIFLKQVMDYVYEEEKTADRIIVITDEQDCSAGSEDSPQKANAFGKYNYMLNVASNENGIGYDKWIHINGFSEAVINYIIESERMDNNAN